MQCFMQKFIQPAVFLIVKKITNTTIQLYKYNIIKYIDDAQNYCFSYMTHAMIE